MYRMDGMLEDREPCKITLQEEGSSRAMALEEQVGMEMRQQRVPHQHQRLNLTAPGRMARSVQQRMQTLTMSLA